MNLKATESIKKYNKEIEELNEHVKNLYDNTDDAITNIANFSDSLTDAEGIGHNLADAFKAVDEDIANVIDSAADLTGGISNIAAAFEGAEVNSAALMSGIQGVASSLGGLFGAEAGSDASQLLSGLGGLGSGIAGFATGDIMGGITSVISSLPSLFDGLTESAAEGYEKMFGKMGFDDTYSQDLLEKMGEVSDRMGDKSFGMQAYIEEFFAETNISNLEEYSRMSDSLNEAVSQYIAEGHTTDEAFDKFGDELQQLVDAQEKYGFETVASLGNMIELQKTQTSEGRLEGLTESLGGFDKIIAGLEKQMSLTPEFELSEGAYLGIAGSLTKSFRQLKAEGMSNSEAIEAVKPLMDKYKGLAKDQGWELTEIPGWTNLNQYFKKMEDVSGVLDMIQGSSDVMSSLSDTAMLDSATFESQMMLGQDVYAQLLSGGLTEKQALQEMGGWLQTTQQAAEKGEFQLPPEIASLIKKAEESGALPEEQKPLGDVIADGLEDGFDRAVGAIETVFGKIAEYGRGGIVKGREGEKKLVWAHAGEAVGYPADIVKMTGADKVLEEQGAQGMLPAIETALRAFDTLDQTQRLAESVVSAANAIGETEHEYIKKLLERNEPVDATKIHYEELVNPTGGEEIARNMARTKKLADEYMERERRKEERLEADRRIAMQQTIENKMSLVFNNREFRQTEKNELCSRIKNNGKKDVIEITSQAVKKE